MVRIEAIGDEATAATLETIDRIFFGASARTSFANEKERGEFRERWLGRYLLHDREHAFVARDTDGEGTIVGYLVGCLDDPAVTSRFSDIGYFSNFADLTANYPAHLHINLDPTWRSQGIGARLIESFACHATRSGSRGVHVVTGAASRNVGFYARCGFERLREATWNGAAIVFLGRKLAP